MQSMTYVGISLDQGMFCVAARCAGQHLPVLQFPADPIGVESLKHHIANIGGPVRLAMAISVATIGIALSLGAQLQREVLLVAPRIANHACALRALAARSM